MAGLFDNDPLLGGYQQEHSRLIEEYRRKAEMQGSRTPLWDKIDAEIAPLTDEQKSHVIGIQANLWTEYIATYDHLEYMVYPRMDAVSEVQWCQPESKDWERFRRGLDRMRSVYEVMGYNYATHIWGE